MSSNLHKLYFKKYFTVGSVSQNNAALLNAELIEIKAPLSKEDGLESFRMKVLYPGLVTGVGLPHQENITGEFKLGMHFDWTWGMPVIYGSSVKGVLSSYFKYEYKGSNLETAMMDIFGSEEKVHPSNKDHVTGGVVFFDAVVVSAPGGHPLADDSITPHKDALSDPIPLPFLKIAPGCVIEFRFKFNNGLASSKENLLAVFKTILKKYGIGAKTNVGYGRLSPV